ncbi:bifunctional transaldolase/phosoglucose isomerase [Entomobacter blattae]|uniref:Transaldolase n=1 Tax=Entomobacter blattae TaxID=2762277 RepID=A0A7H1NNX1_9PROT|nr:bifunctional transaldolase/phosoglucose isomerase [Entomobacter blattae]QNT77481.1 Transaldolase [Entomobacter blattae]
MSAGNNPLKELEKFGQSPWLDFIQRSYTENGSLKKLVDEDGLKGVTSNPAIFEKAMGHGTDYDGQFKQIAQAQITDVSTLYETMAIDDIRAATKVLFPVWEKTKGKDGYVSLEVSPYLANDTQGTIDEARRLWKAVNEKNLMIKIPATPECVPSIQQVISDGINVNVTLLFSLDAYKAVLEAYIQGLEARHKKGEDISHIASVASFFVSRIDTMIDKQIDERVAKGDKENSQLKALRGKVAIANAKMAYQHYLEVMKSDRWKTLAQAGAQPQRLLWASTGVKDKAYPDTLYVDELIGPETVNTIPPATFDAFRDHGKVRASLTENVEEAKKVLADAAKLGINLKQVTDTLLEAGVSSFADAFDALLGSVASKQIALQGEKLDGIKIDLPADMKEKVDAAMEDWRKAGKVRKVWAKDASVWTGDDESKWLGWLDIIDERLENVSELEAFQKDVKAKGFKDILLLGMGGSSLGPEVLAETFGQQAGFPKLHVLDSILPSQVKTFENAVDLGKTLFIVSSKSGGTLEPNVLKAYFYEAAKKVLGDKVGEHFVAVTDPGSHMEEVAKKDKFWKIFHGRKEIGGRYSVLSNFGLVPAVAAGLPVKSLLQTAQRMEKACSAGAPPLYNPGVLLGTVLGVGQTIGRNKVTIIASPAIYDLGAWLEQLLAESTGKEGKALVPIDDETLGDPAVYGKDRVFAYVRLASKPDAAQDKAIEKLIAAGQPVVTISLNDIEHVFQEFFRWEFATAVAGSIMGINAFNQPDVEASKVKTRALTDAYNQTGKLPDEKPFATDGDFSFFTDERNRKELSGNSLAEILKSHFSRVKAGDYVGILAYIERNMPHRKWIQDLRLAVRDSKKVATAAEFGPRFLHSTGQAYKGGSNDGVFLQVTSDNSHADVSIPGEKYTFGVVGAAQARGDFDVLSERGRRVLRVHIQGDLKSGLEKLGNAMKSAVK